MNQIGTVDTLNGILALACARLQDSYQESFAGFTAGELHNGMHSLAIEQRFQEQLRHLDFRRSSDGWYSKALDTQISLSMTFGLAHFTGQYEITTNRRVANSQISRIRKEFGPEVITQLEQMAGALIKATPRYKEFCPIPNLF